MIKCPKCGKEIEDDMDFCYHCGEVFNVGNEELNESIGREEVNPKSLDTKYPFVCHAELNAILNRNTASLKNATLYVTLFPCNECAKAIIQSGIKKVVYAENKYADTEGVKASKLMFEKCGVETVQYKSSGKILNINL